MRLKYLLIAILILTAATAAAVDSDRELGRRAVVKLDTSNTAEKGYIFVAYTSGSGTVMRRASLDSVFKAGGMETTAPEGERYIYPYNGATPFVGTPALGMLATTSTGPKWYDGEAWLPIGVGYDDSALWQKFAGYMLTSTHDTYAAAVQAQIDAQNTQIGQLKQAMLDYGVTLPGAAPATLDPLDFGTINVNTNKVMTAQIDNTGLGNLVTGQATKSGTGADKYTLSGACSNKTIAPGANCIESVTFAPGTVAGTYTAQISFPHNAQGSPTTMSVAGIGQSVQTCGSTPFKDIVPTGPNGSTVGSSIFTVYSGIKVEVGQPDRTLCKVAAHIYSIADGGDLANTKYRVEVWSVDGNGALYEMKGASSSVAANTMTAGTYAVFSFPTPVVTKATYAIVVTRDDHVYNASNYINLTAGTTSTETYAHAIRYQTSKAVAAETVGSGKRFQLYEVQ